MLEGVQVVPLDRHIDDRGYLYEIIHSSDAFLPHFGQTYVIGSPMHGTIRGLHKHAELWDYFCVVKGAAKFVVALAQEDEVKEAERLQQIATPDGLESFVLSHLEPSLLIVPPGLWHGWVALEDDTIVVSTASELYNVDNPDEVRVSPGVFGDVWSVKGR